MMKMIKFVAVVSLLSIALPTSARGQDIHSVAAAVDEHYNHLRSLRAEFTEVYRGSGMERKQRSASHTLWPSASNGASGGSKVTGGCSMYMPPLT